MSNFNSIKVRLKLGGIADGVSSLLFQFHKGTIKTPKAYHHLQYQTIFQFHKGTIKTHRPTHNLVKITGFQFHKGTIKTPLY